MSVPNQVCENGIQHVKLLPATNDDHGGVIVDMEETMDSSAFITLLRASISTWRQQGKKGVWIKLPIDLVHLVQPAVEEGFRYHHAEPKYLMLVYWIPKTTSTIPANASHRVNIGAIVLNDKRELLVVQEKSGIFKGTGVWKIPTGTVDVGEDIFVTATREVKEETGIDTEFLEILAFRSKNWRLRQPSMHPGKGGSFEPKAHWPAQWMPLEEFAAQPFAQKHELFKYIADISLAKLERDYTGLTPLPITSTFNNSLNYLYLNRRDLNNSLTSINQS
ncbi:Nudix hydrolase 10 [Morella rubra]|uniref:Nudix hydrolase 10 n=1 Tax=Morella rubra TaxID=262757 RepID=A0A6A1VQA9_9ROSI|nr:Nudix hydrolase 10 [Morella rubra]